MAMANDISARVRNEVWTAGAGPRALVVLAAAVLGGVLGGVVFKRAGHVAFLAAVVARELWLGYGKGAADRS
jgi:hypothetical protein